MHQDRQLKCPFFLDQDTPDLPKVVFCLFLIYSPGNSAQKIQLKLVIICFMQFNSCKLQCNYQLDYHDGSLYSVKWYKLHDSGRDMTNFYTYMPNMNIKKQTKHRLEGINVVVNMTLFTLMFFQTLPLKEKKKTSKGKLKIQISDLHIFLKWPKLTNLSNPCKNVVTNTH